MSETKKPGFFKRLFGFGGAEEAAKPPEPEKPKAAEKPAAKAPAEKKPAQKPPAAKKPAAKKPAAKKAAEKKPAAKSATATSTAEKAPAAKTPAAKKPAAKKSAAKPAESGAAKTSAKTTSTDKKTTVAKEPAAKKPAAKKTAAKSAGKPATAASKSSKTPHEAEGTSKTFEPSAPMSADEKRRQDKKAADMQPETPPPDSAPVTAPGKERPEEKQPSRRKEEAPEADDEAGPASPRPPEPDAEPGKDDDKEKPEKTVPPAGPGPADTDEEEAGPTAPEPKQLKTQGSGKKKSWFAQLREGLSRTSNALSDNIASVLTKERLDEDTLDDLEDVLIRADLGVEMAERVRNIVAKNRYDRGATAEAVREVLGDEVSKVLDPVAKPFPPMDEKPFVWLVVGVNGTGKTTTIGKLAHRFQAQGKSVMLAAADTFRAAAIDQLKIWGDRVDAQVICHDVGSDPAGVAYDGLKRAQETNTDVLLIDTAGRLQNKNDLMDELAKIVRVVKKLEEDAPHGVLLVLDATTGQNALNQVELFQQVAGVTGLAVTKLDGTARGGILVAIAERFGLPVHAIGVGEGIDDLESFDAEDFARAIAGFGRENAKAA
ncbi:signal recognition particle-docking protein FtsY [Methyloligella solikamskensis]|uniref:Signal recognition particle receptor FtsY n=1 Tax=Methyloligella solikamskensis TaxID=1177756 RepID=A0ABW3J6S7_9HYPH